MTKVFFVGGIEGKREVLTSFWWDRGGIVGRSTDRGVAQHAMCRDVFTLFLRQNRDCDQ